MADEYIAIDWGTTNRRVYLIDGGGRVIESWRDGRGVMAVEQSDYPSEFAAIRERFGALPIIAGGMIGSSRGWREIPYQGVPADLSALAGGAVRTDHDVTLVPGVSQQGEHGPDVMRGEEIQVLGAIAAGLASADGLFCQPGTHNKWIVAQGARITGLATAMTGEIFALLQSSSVLAEMLDGTVEDGRAFRCGLARGSGATDLPVALFRARAAVLLGSMERAEAASFVSGILIGADVGGRDGIKGEEVYLLASGPLASLYETAIGLAGGHVTVIDSYAAFAGGIHQIRMLTR